MPHPKPAILSLLSQTTEGLEKRLQKLKKVVSSFKEMGCSSDPISALAWLDSNRDILSKEAPEVVSFQVELQTLCRDTLAQFDSELREALASREITFTGSWPNYYIGHILPMKVDEKILSITLGEESLRFFALERLLPLIETKLKKLKPDDRRLAIFLREVFATYSKLISPQVRTVAIWDLYR